MDQVRKARRFLKFARKILAMSMEDAKAILGFPPNSSPSAADIKKAYRTLALENHPDRGGDHRRMVEINTAKDILEGRRREDRHPVSPSPSQPQRTPEQEAADRKRRERIKREVASSAILQQSKKVLDAFRLALDAAMPVTQYHLDLNEFLTDTYATAIDALHDEIELTKSDDADWKKAEQLCLKLSSQALRVASKLRSIKKGQEKLKHEVWDEDGKYITLKDMTYLYGETDKFIKAFNAFHDDSRKLVSLITTSEIVPIAWDDQYSSVHGVIDSFHGSFARFTKTALVAFEEQVERSVESVQAQFENLGFSTEFEVDFPTYWRDWKIPQDFVDASDIIAGD